MTNPNQEPAPTEVTLPQALRMIAERVSFRTEEDNNAVLSAIDKAIADDDEQRREDEELAERLARDAEQGDQGDGDQGDGDQPAPAKRTRAKATA